MQAAGICLDKKLQNKNIGKKNNENLFFLIKKKLINKLILKKILYHDSQ